MAITALVTAFLAQALEPSVVNAPTFSPEQVGYEELVRGDAEAAIARIRANRSLSADDPAALINLGAAHLRLGRPREAHAYYMAAIASSDRQYLELADGSWMDSRRAARTSISLLASNRALALR